MAKPEHVSVDCKALDKQGIGCLTASDAARFGHQPSVAALRNCMCATVRSSVNADTLEKHNYRVRRIEVEKNIKLGSVEVVGYDGTPVVACRLGLHDGGKKLGWHDGVAMMGKWGGRTLRRCVVLGAVPLFRSVSRQFFPHRKILPNRKLPNRWNTR